MYIICMMYVYTHQMQYACVHQPIHKGVFVAFKGVCVPFKGVCVAFKRVCVAFMGVCVAFKGVFVALLGAHQNMYFISYTCVH